MLNHHRSQAARCWTTLSLLEASVWRLWARSVPWSLPAYGGVRTASTIAWCAPVRPTPNLQPLLNPVDTNTNTHPTPPASVMSHEPAFEALLIWLQRESKTLSGSNVIVQNQRETKNRWQSVTSDQISMLPGRGMHVVWYKGKMLWITRWCTDITTTGKCGVCASMRGFVGVAHQWVFATNRVGEGGCGVGDHDCGLLWA